MATTPAFAITPRFGYGVATAALDTLRGLSPSANIVTLLTGVAAGTRINRVRVRHVGAEAGGAPADTVLRFWIFDGTSYVLVHEEAVASATAPTGTAAGYGRDIPELAGIVLPSASHTIVFGSSAWAAAKDNMLASVEGADL